MPRALSEMSNAPVNTTAVNTTALIQTRASSRKMTATKMSAFEDFVLGSEWLAKGGAAGAEVAQPSFEIDWSQLLPDVPAQNDTPSLIDDCDSPLGSPPFGAPLLFESAFRAHSPETSTAPLFSSPTAPSASLPPAAFIQPAADEPLALSPLQLTSPVEVARPLPRRSSSLKRELTDDVEADDGDDDYVVSRDSASPVPMPPTKRRTARQTRRSSTVEPALDIDIDAPIVERKYKITSRTSKKARPAAMSREIQKAVANGESVDEVVDSKRRRNTIAARISRQRKAEHLQEMEAKAARADELEALVESLQDELKALRQLVAQYGTA